MITGFTVAIAMQDSVAQLVEQYTFNVWVLGSNPSRITLMKAPPFGKRFFHFKPTLSSL